MQPEHKQPGFWQPNTAPTYHPEPLEEHPVPAQSDDLAQTLSWQASESIHQEKQAIWFVSIFVAALVLAAFSLFFLRSVTFAVLVIVMAFSLIIIARRPPRVLNYQLGPHGLQIDQKKFDYHEFRAFGVMQEGAMYSIVLLPNKRFMPNVNIYFPPENGEHIVDIFGAVLPMEHVEPDFLDNVIRKLHLQ